MTPWKGEVPGDLGGILDRTTEIWVLRLYWEHLFVVPLLGCYYITPFKGHRGVTQEDPLYPTIFNKVVDAVICPWVALVAGKDEGT